MKHRRNSSMAMAVTGLLLVGFGVWIVGAITESSDAHREQSFRGAHVEGRVLNAIDLGPDDRLEITRVRVRHGGADAQTFLITGGPEKRLICMECPIGHRSGWGIELGAYRPARSVVLTPEQQCGFDLWLQFVQEPFSLQLPYHDTYEIACLSGVKTIGTHRIIDYSRQLEFYRSSAYEELPPEFRARHAPSDWAAIQAAYQAAESLTDNYN
jgi:hypothetical protein